MPSLAACAHSRRRRWRGWGAEAAHSRCAPLGAARHRLPAGGWGSDPQRAGDWAAADHCLSCSHAHRECVPALCPQAAAL